MKFPHNELFPSSRMSPLTAASTEENDATEVVIKSFDLFHDRVDRAFHSMNPSSSSSKSEFWRTSAVLAIRLPGKHIEDDDKEEEEEEDKEERENTNDDCLFGTKKETRKSIGKCDRLDRETEFDGDDMMAVGATEDFMVVKRKRKRYVPDHERFPEKYVKYSFDEPVVVGGGESGILEKKKRKKEKTDVDEVRDLGVPQDALARSADVEKTRRDVGEPRIMRGKKKKEGADVEKESRKRTKRVTRSLSIATTSIAAQDVEENGGG